jgi:hypothetical protein
MYTIGDDIKVFLIKNLDGVDTMNFNNIEKIEWSGNSVQTDPT